jgi:Uma2 family endonuclease
MEQTITHAPIAVFEVLSPEDTVKRLKHKLAQYASMGIPQIWVVDPENGSFERYQNGLLAPAKRFEHGTMQFKVSEIASLLQS